MFEFLIGIAALALGLGVLVAGPLALILVIGLRRRVKQLESEPLSTRPRFDAPEGAGSGAPPTRSGAPASAASQATFAPAVASPAAPPTSVPAAHAAAVEVSSRGAAASRDPIQAPQVERGALSRATPPSAAPAPSAPPATGVTWDQFESRLGTRWLNWIGALVSLLAAAFLLKFLYDQGLVGPAGRVAIGLGAGLGFLFFGELRLRRIHDQLSQAVSALGAGTLFLTAYLSFKFYGFGGQLATFALMAWFALFAVALAVLRNGKILATLGLVCAYASPFLLSTGQDSAEALFAYLALLAVAGLFVRLQRDWPAVTPLGLALSAIYYAGWHARFFAPDRTWVAVAGAVGLGALFTVSALVRPLARGLVPTRAAGVLDLVSAALAQVAALFFLWITLAGRLRLELGFALTATALFDLALIWALRRRRAGFRAAEDTLVLLAAAILALVIPAVLRAEGALVAWSLAAVVLADAASRSQRASLAFASVAALLAALFTGLGARVFHTGVFVFALNGVCLAWLVAGAAWLIAGERTAVALAPASSAPRAAVAWRIGGRALQCFGGVLLLALATYEVGAWFSARMDLVGDDRATLTDLRTSSLLALWALFPALYVWRARTAPALWVHAALHYALLGLGFLALSARLHYGQAWPMLNAPFAAAVLFPAAIFFVARRVAQRHPRFASAMEVYALALIAFLLAGEIRGTLGRSGQFEHGAWIGTAMVSVAWAIQAFVVLSIGMRIGRRSWRWFALLLLAATLAKVMLVDLSQVRQIWRVLSFAAMGALLMASSYVYARREKRKPVEKTRGDADESKQDA